MAGGSVDKETAVGNCGALALRVLLVGWLCRGKEKALRVSIEKNLHSAVWFDNVSLFHCHRIPIRRQWQMTSHVNGVPYNV